jgi:protein-L-isoaspartate(D-aspartate) O-methyltransferase
MKPKAFSVITCRGFTVPQAEIGRTIAPLKRNHFAYFMVGVFSRPPNREPSTASPLRLGERTGECGTKLCTATCEKSIWRENGGEEMKSVISFPLALVCAWVQPVPPAAAADFADAREAMVVQQMAARDIKDERVLAAIREVPRHEFVPAEHRNSTYEDTPLPIGHGQTISQPYIVAFMTERLAPKPTDRVLEIGAGSGYQAAVLSKLVKEVFTIEIVEPLATRAAADLQRLGFKNVHVKAGDGYEGWPEHAPFDAVIVTCAPDHVPEALVRQLKDGGRMIIPVGGERGPQELYILEKRGGELKKQSVLPVRFVPMTGKGQKK